VTTSDISVDAGRRLAARSTALDDATGHDLLESFSPDGFAWFDGDHGFVTTGIAAVVAPADAAELLGTIAHTSVDGIADGAGPRAVGALPFGGGGELVIPAVIVGRDEHGRIWRTVVDTDEPDATPAANVGGPAPGAFTVKTHTTRAEWCAIVEQALVEIGLGAAEKIVLARAVSVEADLPFDLAQVLAHLRRAQPGCIVYADRGFVGASPELLVRKTGASITSRPLAGTGLDPNALTHSAKDGYEHRLVVDAVVDALRALGSDVRAQGPFLLELADVSHLATTITARADRSSTTVVDVVDALHPTPAVAGTPRPAALDAIAALETVPRGRYAGPCGWIDRNGDGEFVVALRGGEIDGAHAVIHAGAGIVAGSDPDAEWTETQQKLTPMLQALVRP
jgi:menaquinone-specific isochorismate synthase